MGLVFVYIRSSRRTGWRDTVAREDKQAQRLRRRAAPIRLGHRRLAVDDGHRGVATLFVGLEDHRPVRIGERVGKEARRDGEAIVLGLQVAGAQRLGDLGAVDAALVA